MCCYRALLILTFQLTYTARLKYEMQILMKNPHRTVKHLKRVRENGVIEMRKHDQQSTLQYDKPL